VVLGITSEQVMDILNIGYNFPPVSYSEISTHQSGSIYVSITSVVDAAVDDILSVLSEVFPSIINDGEPSVRKRCDGKESDLYQFKTGVKGLSISLHMIRDAEKAPTAMGADAEGREENTQPKFIIDNSKIEPLVDRVWAEEILRSEGIVENG